ncbi:hepatic and glial cell adhesion molecule-like [Xenentodon cancila]
MFFTGGETHCDGRQDGVQCFGALGGTLVLQLMDNDTEINRYQWKKEETVILHGRKNKIIHNTLENRSVFIPSNGTFLINNLIRTDSGQYTLNIFGSDGRKTGYKTLQLVVEAPVSSVLLVSECLSEGQMKVSCSSDGGDSPQYSWTLDGHTLTDSELLSGAADTNIIILKQNVSGRLVCSVRNHISRVSNETILTTCGFIFINCISNGTQISKWVFKENNTLCTEPTTVATTVGGETYCDSRQDGVQCFGALGGTLVLQLMDNASEIHRYYWDKEGPIILRGKNNKIITNKLDSRSVY